MNWNFDMIRLFTWRVKVPIYSKSREAQNAFNWYEMPSRISPPCLPNKYGTPIWSAKCFYWTMLNGTLTSKIESKLVKSILMQENHTKVGKRHMPYNEILEKESSKNLRGSLDSAGRPGEKRAFHLICLYTPPQHCAPSFKNYTVMSDECFSGNQSVH